MQFYLLIILFVFINCFSNFIRPIVQDDEAYFLILNDEQFLQTNGQKFDPLFQNKITSDISEYPNQKENLNILAIKYFREGNFELSENIWNNTIQKSPEKFDVFFF
jgi:hypothetical protein